MIECSKTDRNFPIGTFTDLYGSRCSVQDSSLATKDAIWLGVDQHFNHGDVNCRMHLDRDMAAALIPLLQCFVASGSISQTE